MAISDKPRLKIKYFGNPAEDYCNLEQARYILNFDRGIVLAEGQKVLTYADLVELVARGKHRNKDFIEIVILPALTGG